MELHTRPPLVPARLGSLLSERGARSEERTSTGARFVRNKSDSNDQVKTPGDMTCQVDSTSTGIAEVRYYRSIAGELPERLRVELCSDV